MDTTTRAERCPTWQGITSFHTHTALARASGVVPPSEESDLFYQFPKRPCQEDSPLPSPITFHTSQWWPTRWREKPLHPFTTVDPQSHASSFCTLRSSLEATPSKGRHLKIEKRVRALPRRWHPLRKDHSNDPRWEDLLWRGKNIEIVFWRKDGKSRPTSAKEK